MKPSYSYKETASPGSLSGFVKCFWAFDNPTNETPIFTILPDGCFDLLITYSNGRLINITLTGLWTKPIDADVSPFITTYAIRFQLLAAEYIFQRSVADLLNTDVKMPDSFFNISREQPHSLEQFAHTMSGELNKIITLREIDERKRTLFDIIYREEGNVKIEHLASKIYWSARQVNRYFNNYFGLSLKAYCNILRCYAAFNAIKHGELSPGKDFFDQPHFIREIKKHTGVNPKILHQNKDGRFIQFSDFSSD